MNIHGARRAGRRGRKACMGWSWAAACGVQGRGHIARLTHSLLKLTPRLQNPYYSYRQLWASLRHLIRRPFGILFLMQWWQRLFATFIRQQFDRAATIWRQKSDIFFQPSSNDQQLIDDLRWLLEAGLFFPGGYSRLGQYLLSSLKTTLCGLMKQDDILRPGCPSCCQRTVSKHAQTA